MKAFVNGGTEIFCQHIITLFSTTRELKASSNFAVIPEYGHLELKVLGR